MDDGQVTLLALQPMKQDGRRIVGVVTYDYLCMANSKCREN